MRKIFLTIGVAGLLVSTMFLLHGLTDPYVSSTLWAPASGKSTHLSILIGLFVSTLIVVKTSFRLHQRKK